MYQPSSVWEWNKKNGGKFSKINKPTSGSTFVKKLPIGEHDLQLYSQGTPNGIKVTILLEELLELNYNNADYNAWLIEINKGDQFSSGFVEINPNSKIPALVDYSYRKPLFIFESGSILLYLADKFGEFIPKNFIDRVECLNWLFWQMSSTPYVGGGFGHFYSYAPEKLEYPIDRYTMETKRQLDVLNKHLSCREYICSDFYSISDIAIWAWYGQLVLGKLYSASEFLNVSVYKNVLRWAHKINSRPAVKRGKIVNKVSGNKDYQLKERHSINDFDKIKF